MRDELPTPPPRTVFLEDFDAPLTYVHSVVTLEDPAFFRTCYRVVEVRPDLIRPQVRLHADHVLLFKPRLGGDAFDAAWLEDWAKQRRFAMERPTAWFLADSRSPVGEGYFRCLCVTQTAAPKHDPLGDLDWQPADGSESHDSLGTLLSSFIKSEVDRVGEDCRHGLHPPSGRDGNNRFLMWDDETAYLEFAAAVVSPDELRFWSRPVQYHK